MDVSLDEAAVLLGKSARQVRYLIQQGKLTARKDGSRWVIQRAPANGVAQLRAWKVGGPSFGS